MRVRTTSATDRSEVSGLCYGGGLRQPTDVYQTHTGTDWLRDKRSVNVEHSADRLAGAMRIHDHGRGSVRDPDPSGYDACQDSAEGEVVGRLC